MHPSFSIGPRNDGGMKLKSNRGKLERANVERANEIFDILYKDNQLRIIGRHRFSSKEELKGRDYCKWHSTYTCQQILCNF